MEIIIRKADTSDLEGLKDLYLGLHKHHVVIDELYADEKQFEDRVETVGKKTLEKETALVLVAQNEKGEYLGFGAFEIINRANVKQSFGYIKKAYVKDECRGHGIFKKIYEKGMEWFKENGIEYVELTCNVNNKEGQSTWGALGFEEVKKVMRKRI